AAGEGAAGGVGDAEAVCEERVVEWAVEPDRQRLRRSRGRAAQVPRGGGDPRPDGRSDVVAPRGAGAQRTAFGVAERRIDGDDDRRSLDEGVAEVLVRDEAALDPAGVQQQREASMFAVPQLGAAEEHA